MDKDMTLKALTILYERCTSKVNSVAFEWNTTGAAAAAAAAAAGPPPWRARSSTLIKQAISASENVILHVRVTTLLKYQLKGTCNRSKSAAAGISKRRAPNSRRARLKRLMRRLMRWLHILLQMPMTRVSPNSRGHQIGSMGKQYKKSKCKKRQKLRTAASKYTSAAITVQRKKKCARWYSKLTNANTATRMENYTKPASWTAEAYRQLLPLSEKKKYR